MNCCTKIRSGIGIVYKRTRNIKIWLIFCVGVGVWCLWWCGSVLQQPEKNNELDSLACALHQSSCHAQKRVTDNKRRKLLQFFQYMIPLETDHKPLVFVFGNSLSPKLQRIRTRPMRLVVADALSKGPLTVSGTEKLSEGIQDCIQKTIKYFLLTDICTEIMQYFKENWTGREKIS